MKDETLKRVWADLPIIYFATVGGAISHVLIFTENKLLTFKFTLKILFTTFMALLFVFSIYLLIYIICKKCKAKK